MADQNLQGLIDLDEVVATKFKGRKIPKFVVNWLKRLIHQDFLNDIIRNGGEGAAFCDYTLKYLDVDIDVEGLENVPSDGTRYTFASNHPLGGVDGIALCSLISRHFGDMRMPVNDFLMFIKPLAPLCVPINKVGGQARNLPLLLGDAFASDKQLLMFPAGLCSRKIDGKVQDLPWTKTFIKMSVDSGRSIVPVHFIGHNSARFYRVSNLSKALKFKVNIAMAFLPDELYKARKGHYKIVFGKPLPCDFFDKSKTALEWAGWMRDKVYQL